MPVIVRKKADAQVGKINRLPVTDYILQMPFLQGRKIQKSMKQGSQSSNSENKLT